MARPLRIEFPGAFYHVTSRGDRREDIFVDDADRKMWLEVLSQTCGRFEVTCHAYCLMSNHYHVVLETAKPNLARALRALNGIYTQRFNRRHGHSGHVFQGRYKAIIVDRDAYYLEVIRYVLLNPVRAKLAKRAGDWSWSSYGAVMGTSPTIWGLEVSHLLSQLAPSTPRARKAFEHFVAQGMKEESLWTKLVGQIYLGDEHFAKRLQKKVIALQSSEVPRAQRRGRVVPLRAYERKYRDRDQAIAIAYLSGHYTMQQIARHFGVHYATVSRALKKAEQRTDRNV